MDHLESELDKIYKDIEFIRSEFEQRRKEMETIEQGIKELRKLFDGELIIYNISFLFENE